MSKAEDEQQARLERAREIGLFRYMLIRTAAEPTLSKRERGAMVRAIAAQPHKDPFGRIVKLTRWTLDRWVRDWQRDGFDALVPNPRQSAPRTPAEVLELAAALKKENPGMLHRHASHNEAVARISWCISERSIGVVTGEVGAGKTVSVRTVLSGLDTSKHTVIYLANPLIGVRGIHEAIVTAFGGAPTNLSSRLARQAGAALTAEREERGRTPVLILDEAHLLSYEQLETIRMLSNASMDQDSPLACLLVGQPTLRRTMKLAILAALEQRTALRYSMPGMTSAETTSYIKHHLGLADRSDPLFTEDAVGLIHSTARGYPRAINNLSLQALVATFAAGKSLVDDTAARAAVTEVLD